MRPPFPESTKVPEREIWVKGEKQHHLKQGDDQVEQPEEEQPTDDEEFVMDEKAEGCQETMDRSNKTKFLKLLDDCALPAWLAGRGMAEVMQNENRKKTPSAGDRQLGHRPKRCRLEIGTQHGEAITSSDS